MDDRVFGVPRPPTVVLLHGFAGTPEDWVPVVHGRVDALALTLPGHRPGLPCPDDFKAAVRDLHGRLPAGPIDLVGYSLGGRLALGLADAYPDHIRRLFLISAHTGLSDAEVRAARLARDAAWADRLRSQCEAFFEDFDALPLFKGQFNPRLDEWKARRAALDPEALAQVLHRLSTGGMPNLRPRVLDPEVNVTLAVGERDESYREHYARLAHGRPGLAVHVMPDSAHRVLIDAPQTLGHLLAAWVQEDL